MRIIHGNIKMFSDLSKKSGCVLYLKAYYTRRITVLTTKRQITFWDDDAVYICPTVKEVDSAGKVFIFQQQTSVFRCSCIVVIVLLRPWGKLLYIMCPY